MWIGLDVGKEEHFADVLDNNGDPLFAKSISNHEADLVALLDRPGGLSSLRLAWAGSA